MRTRNTEGQGFAVALALIASACTEPSSPAPKPLESVPGPAQELRLLRGTDREFVQLAREIPGFGGMYRAPDGRFIVYLTDTKQLGKAKEALVRRGLLKLASIDGIQVRTAQNNYIELADWRGRLRSGLDASGLVFTDIDESANRVRVGVLRGTSHEVVESEIAKLGIPRDAVEVEDAEPIMRVATLQDRIRPALGGIQILWPHAPNRFFICTLGFNVQIPDEQGSYFVTNAHCSGDQGGVQNTPFYQPLTGDENLIAREVADPELFSEGCYPGRRCRFSDAALARYEDGVESRFGAIARTTLRGLTAGSGLIDDRNPYFRIVDRRPFPLLGQTLDKLGRTTGWTVGTVVQTCIDTFVGGIDIALLCQDRVVSGVGPGDSGSPVFESQSPAGSGGVTLYGILWGSSNTNFGPSFVMSSLENIEFELGRLIVNFTP
ncbi:MAG: S1 family peptidase [Gemmatimonadota bacterium]|nr:S1 family peptidase [Gemmatimonadota bacterium]